MTEITPALGLSAYFLGRRIAGQRRKPERVPVAYLYNGVRLPALPEWDRVKYPYAVLGAYALKKSITLYVSSKPAYYSGSYVIPTPSVKYKINEELTEWGDPVEITEDIEINLGIYKWANHDVYYTSSTGEQTLHLAASDPVPVYE